MILEILVRTFTALLSVLLFFRITGKKEVGELGVLEVIVSVMVADLAVRIIDHEGTPIWKLLIPIIFLTVLQLSISYLSLKIQKFRGFVGEKPVFIVKNGEILVKKMAEQNLNLDDLMEQLRQKNIWDLREVHSALLEPKGTISIVKKSEKEKFTLPLIQDGIIQTQNINYLDLSEEWLRRLLEDQGISHRIDEISYLSFNENKAFIALHDKQQ